MCTALVPVAPAFGAPDDVRAVVRDVATELPSSIAMRRGEAIHLGVDDLIFEGAAGEILSIEFGGTLVAVSEGMATVRPVRNGVQGAPIRVQVTGSPVSSMRVDGAPVRMTSGEAVRMRAVAYRLDFSVDDVTQTAGWTSSDPEVLRVDDAGRVVGVGPGVAVIDAWADGCIGRSGIIRVE
ncbi:MAG: hypothetical protein ACJARS_003499 [bacterium]